jgi:hypothetical protein
MHLVHFKDGSKKVATDDQLNKLDPTTWDAAEPYERDRFVVISALQADDSVTFSVEDRGRAAVVGTFDSRAEATALATSKNLSEGPFKFESLDSGDAPLENDLSDTPVSTSAVVPPPIVDMVTGSDPELEKKPVIGTLTGTVTGTVTEETQQ